MGAPIPTALVTEFGSASTTHNCVMPATINANDLLLLFFTCRGSVTFTTPSDWDIESARTANSTVLSSIVYSKIAVGNEDGTNVNVVSSASGIAVGIAVRVTGWRIGGSLANDVVSGTPSTGSNLSVNPPSVSWAWGSSDDVLIIAFPSIGSSGGAATDPGDYTPLGNGSVGSGSSGLRGDTGYRQRLSAASPEDPGNFVYSSGLATEYVAHTVAIRGTADAYNNQLVVRQAPMRSAIR